MKLLHITNDYSGSVVYKNLVEELDKLSVVQVVYNPVRELGRIGRNKIELRTPGSMVIYSHVLNRTTDRVFYPIKIGKIKRDIEKKVDVRQFDLIHAHTWYSDGGVAYELYKKYNLPYIIAIRNSDLNLFWKLPYLKRYGLKILKNASKVILISETYKNRVISDVKISNCIVAKYEVVPNGVDAFWIKNVEDRKTNIGNPVQLLYIGNNSKNKNIDKLVQAVNQLNAEGSSYTLNLVGPILDRNNKNNSNKPIKNCIYHGPIFERDKLKVIIRNSDIFTMPSKSETFGLVYIEALSQGIPIVYTKNEGIDGLYNNIGEAVDANSVKDIANGIKKICNNYASYDFSPKEILSNHDWNNIAFEYFHIYQKVAKCD